MSDQELDAIDRMFPSHIKVMSEADEKKGLVLIEEQRRKVIAERVKKSYILQHNDGAPIRNQKGKRIGRNDPCPCGSGKKFKTCHMNDKDYQTIL